MNKSEDLSDQIIFHIPHKKPEEWPNPLMIISIDVGRKNLCIRIENRYQDKRYSVPVHDLINLGPNRVNPIPYHTNLDIYLEEKIEPYLKDVCVVIIEKQLPINYVAVRLQGDIIGHFCRQMRIKKIEGFIVEVAPVLKGLKLGAPHYTKNNKDALKLWTICKVIELAIKREEICILDKFVKVKSLEFVKELVLDKEYEGTDLYEYIQYAKSDHDSKKKDKKFKNGRFDGEIMVDFLKPGKKDDYADTCCQINAVESELNLPSAQHYFVSDTDDTSFTI